MGSSCFPSCIYGLLFPSISCLKFHYWDLPSFPQNIMNRGFHVTSYQANFASHDTCDCHVDFLSAQDGIGKKQQNIHNFFLVHTILPNYNRVTRISTHAQLKFQIPP